MNKYNLKQNRCNVPLFVHVEITERCPLKCPQCYCDYVTGNDMDFNLYSKLVSQITEMGIDSVLLTGGEPLIYPNIFNAIMLLKENNITVSIASSGYGIDRQFAKKLKEIGTDEIFISLNGSNHNIHNLSRDKFEVSIHAIKTLKSEGVWCGVNWVARRDNLQDFDNLVSLCQEMHVDHIDILSSKNNSNGENNSLTNEELKFLANKISLEYSSLFKKGYIGIDLCYHKLNYLLGQSHPLLQKCIAGRYFFDILTTGEVSPCRHLGYKTKSDFISDYWNNDVLLCEIRHNSHCQGCDD